MVSVRIKLLATAVAILLLSLPLLSQTTTGRIVGNINDESGAVIPGVEIVVRNPATGLVRNVITNESGAFTVPLLPPAVYDVEASLAGFRKEVRSGVTVQVDIVVRVDFSLHVGNVTDEIQVTGDAPLVQSETASLGQIMDSHKVTDIPLNQRNIMSLTLLTTGVMPTVQGSNLSTQSGSFQTMGASERNNNFLLDGVDNNDPGNGQLAIVPSIDAIQEFKLETATYGAEFGRAAGGVLNIQTKSGTNDFHATVFEFLRNDIFDARNFFATTTPPYRRNQFGTVVSGPVKKDRMFFLFNYEGNRIRNVGNKLTNVPTVLQRQGDFSEWPSPIIDPQNGQPFPGNKIPANRMDPIGLKLATFYPLPNRVASGANNTNNYLISGKGKFDFDIITGRVDYRISDKQNIFTRFNWQTAYQDDPRLDTATLPNSGNIYFQPIGRNAAVSDTYVFGPTVVNEFRIGFNRLIGGIFEELYKQNLTKDLGIHGVQSELYPNADGWNFGWPRVTVTGYGGMVSGFSAQNRFDNTWHLYDMLAVTHGNHQMKIGGEYRTMMLNIYIESAPNGTFGFDGRYTRSGSNPANGFADLLLGYASSTRRTVGDPHVQNRNVAVSLFYQDDWKVTPHLTFNLGMRWEVQTPPIDRLDALSTFWMPAAAVVIGGKSGPQTFSNPLNRNQTLTVPGGADFGIPAGLYRNDWNDYGPRFGFAWSPASRSMVVRGGYGIFYEPIIAAITHTFRDASYPWLVPQSFTPTAAIPFNGSGVLTTLSNPFPDALATGSTTANAIDLNLRNGYLQQWNLGIQHPVGSNMVLDLSYAGSKGTKLIGSRNINQPALGPGGAATINARRPIPAWGNVSQTEDSSSSNYNSFQAKFERRFAAGATFVSAYTWSHALQCCSGAQDNSDLRTGGRGNASFDIRHRLVNSYSYELPIGPGKHFLSGGSGIASKLVGGWQLAGITTFSTGQAQTPSVNGDISNTGAGSVHPNRVGDGVLPRDQRSVLRWYDRSAFTVPATGTYGNAGVGFLHAPGINNWDLTLMKNTKIAEKKNLQFRAEFFNAWNHPQFLLPSTEITSASFGTITQARDGRQIQLGLKLYY
jgi:hypothetical protein